MWHMRVYLPATAQTLAQLAASPASASAPADLVNAPQTAYAVTKALASSAPGADQEELEWEAFLGATVGATALLLSDPAAPPMRVILSLDIPDGFISEISPDDDGQLSAVQVQPTDQGKLAALHVDEPNTAPLIANLRKNPDSDQALEAVLDADMLWYDPSEVAEIPTPE